MSTVFDRDSQSLEMTKARPIPDKNTLRETIESARKRENFFAALLGIGLVGEVAVAFWFGEGRPLEIALNGGLTLLVAVGFVGETIFGNKSDDASNLLRALLEQETEALQRGNLELLARIQPRRIDPATAHVRASELAPYFGQKFHIISGQSDLEAAILGEQIRDLLLRAGWIKHGDNEAGVFWSLLVGVRISPGATAYAGKAGESLRRVLESAGIASRIGAPSTSPGDNSIIIAIGSKPPPELLQE